MSNNNNSGKGQKQALPAPVMQIRINLLSNGDINVQGFPNDHTAASEIFEKALRVVNQYFIELAKQGQLDELNRKKDGILIPDKRIVMPGR